MNSLLVFSIDDQNICEAKSAAPMKNRVFTEMEVVSPGACIHISVCTDGTPSAICPVTKKPFKPGDPIYILNEDIPRIRQAVPCISAMGLKKLGMVSEDETKAISYRAFKDPFGRVPERNMWAKLDYTLFFIFDDVFLEQGICLPPGSEHIIESEQ